MQRPTRQAWYNKQQTSIVGPGDPVWIPRIAPDEIDYEGGELGVVIGRRCKNVPNDKSAVLDVIAGFTIVNDVSVRNWQELEPGMVVSKSFDTHGPIGPWIVTSDEIGDPLDLRDARPGHGLAAAGERQTQRRRRTMADGPTQNATDVITKISPRTVADTVSRLTGLLAAKGMKTFDVINQRAEARGAGLDLRDTTLVIFGSPAAGTPVMAAAPLSALDLPLKVLVWDDSGQTKVSYYAPTAIAARHHLDADLAANLAGIDPLTDALVAP